MVSYLRNTATEEEFRVLRDGQTVTNDDGEPVKVPGMFDAGVFDQSVQEFLDKKDALANYFDPNLTEDIFAYIPQQKTSLVFTSQSVVKEMVDILEAENPGIFSNPNVTFADLFSKAGLFLMEIVRRLDAGLFDQIPDNAARLYHILTKQIFALSPNELMRAITLEAVSGGDPERKQWLEESGHILVGEIAKMTSRQTQDATDVLLGKAGGMFDVVIGNPPYQNDPLGVGLRAEPVYDKFIDRAYPLTNIAILIIPARFLTNAGQTPKAWNGKILSDEHLRVISHYPNSSDVFDGTDIKGGVVITYRDVNRDLGPIGTFTSHDEIASILQSRRRG